MQQENSARERFTQHFPKPHSLVVALHSKNLQHALEGAAIAYDNGADGVALVTHVLQPEEGINIIAKIKEKYPAHQAIINILEWSPDQVFQAIEGMNIDWVRTDRANIYGVDTDNETLKRYAPKLSEIREITNPDAVYFGPLNFKHQMQVPEEALWFAMAEAKKYLDVVTTSGDSTGESADVGKVEFIKSLAKNHPVGLASGITPANIGDYIDHHDISIVATGISKDLGDRKDYWNLDPARVAELAEYIQKYNSAYPKYQYGKSLLQKYKVKSFEELNDFFTQNSYINISSGNDNLLEKELSNLSYSPFTLDGVEYASVEAFRMRIKYPENDLSRNEIRYLYGLAAKKAGQEADSDRYVYYNGKHIIKWSDEHHALLKRAIAAKLEQNPSLKQLLIESWDRPIVHILFDKNMQWVHPDSTTIPGEKFAAIVEELRDELE